jgi:hypothetical protein
MEINNKERKSLEHRGIPHARVNSSNWDMLLMDSPSDLDIALAEMENNEVITLEQFKKEFKKWRHPAVRMPKYHMVFTKHFVAQLYEVLACHEETHGYPEVSYAIFECLCRDLRRLPNSPLKDSYPTTNPKVRYIMSMSINVTYYYDLENLTVLSICT